MIPSSLLFSRFSRQVEPHYRYTLYIVEFWNTFSNLPFIVFGLFRLYELATGNKENPALMFAYCFMVAAGFASAIHHGVDIHYKKWTILLDWIPIALSIFLIHSQNYLSILSFLSWIKILIAISILLVDHLYRLVPVPWGHVFWHIIAAFAIDSAYQDVLWVHQQSFCK